MAIETGFFAQESKLTPELSFDLMFYASSLLHNRSLDNLVSYLEIRYGIQIRKQLLDERFREKTVHFVKAVLRRLIHEQFLEMLFSKDFFPTIIMLGSKIPPNSIFPAI